MNDYDKLKALLTEFGVGFTERPHLDRPERKSIVCTCGDERVGGYTFFLTEFEFDKDGKFIEMGAWE